jgi:hypothetical protein
MMKTSVKTIVSATLIASAFALGACSTDGAYSSLSIGVSSYDGYDGYGYAARGDRDWDGIPNRFDRDRDGDGVPNRFDSRPNNPRWR